jgi:uncharacterized membrane protein YbaN (DUF454 family)
LIIKGELSSNKAVRMLWIILGSISLGIGLLGIILPLIPTTPLLLLAAYCYARGSKKMHRWLLNHRWFGKYIRNYYEGKGIPLAIKIYAIAIIWITISITAFFIIDFLWGRILLYTIAIVVSIYLIHIKTLVKDPDEFKKRK